MKNPIYIERAEILEKRLKPISAYIQFQAIEPNGVTFREFLDEMGITYEQFVEELPSHLKNVPAEDLDQIKAYAMKLNEEFKKYNQVDFNGSAGIVDGDYLASYAADGYHNGDGMGLITPEEDPDNWVEMVTYDGKSESDLRWALGRAWTMMAEWERQLEEKRSQNDEEAVVYLGMKLDDGAALIDWLTKRINGTINANIARAAFEERHHYRVQEWEAFKKSRIKPSAKFFDQLKATLDEIGRVAGQNWRSIVSGLKKSPKEIMDDLKKEIQKASGDVRTAIRNLGVANPTGEPDKNKLHLLNRYNPVFVTARGAFLKLVEMNVFGLAGIYNRMRGDADQSFWRRATNVFYKLGGDPAKFEQAINSGKDKPMLLRADGQEYMNISGGEAAGILASLTAATGAIGAAAGMGPATLAIVGSAGGVLTAMVPVIVSFKKKKGEKSEGPTEDPVFDNNGVPQNPQTPTGPTPDTGKMKKIIIGSIVGVALLTTGIVVYSSMKSSK